MNFNDYQKKGFDTSFDYAQDTQPPPARSPGIPPSDIRFPDAPGGIPAADFK
jgi:hypothetical protein